MRWSENDALFRRELEAGFKWQRYVAFYLLSRGLWFEMPAFTWRSSIKETSRYTNEPDIVCCGEVLEVKSRLNPRYRFTSPQDFPFSTVLVETVSGWNAKSPKPYAYINICPDTKGMICLSGRTRPLWSKKRRYDNVRGIHDTWYEAPTKLWRPIDSLVDALLRKLKGGDT